MRERAGPPDWPMQMSQISIGLVLFFFLLHLRLSHVDDFLFFRLQLHDPTFVPMAFRWVGGGGWGGVMCLQSRTGVRSVPLTAAGSTAGPKTISPLRALHQLSPAKQCGVCHCYLLE